MIFVEHLEISKILPMDSNNIPALLVGQTDNPDGTPPLITDSDEDENFHLLRVSRNVVLGRGVAHPAPPGRCLSLSLLLFCPCGLG